MVDPGPATVVIMRSMRRTILVLGLVLLAAIGVASPAGALLTGVDVASYQHPGGAPINWGKVKAAGHSYAFVKATESTTYTNPYFAQDWSGAAAAGLYRGAYHYARPAKPFTTAIDQARYFVSRAGSETGPLDIGPVLDLEETGALTSTDLATWTRTWLAEVTRLTGKAPIIYTGFYFWRDKVGSPADLASSSRLWLASYPSDPNSTTFQPLVPAGWSRWTFWQYRSDGTVPGIPWRVDMNRYCCDLSSLAALAGPGATGGTPFGAVDAITPSYGHVVVDGWAVSPDWTGPVDVHVYVGPAATATTANLPRPDVNAAYGGFFGDDHGYHLDLPVDGGTYNVCVFAIGLGTAPHAVLGCKVVTVPSSSPFGNVEVAATAYGYNLVSGWALDPDTHDPIQLRSFVYDYSSQVWSVTSVVADRPRPDVDASYHLGADHGFSSLTRRTGSTGAQLMCVVGIDVGGGANAFIGCRVV